MTESVDLSPHCWTTPNNALKLILTGSAIGRLSPEQRVIYMNVLARIEKHKAGNASESELLPGVRTIKHFIDEKDTVSDTFCHIPDLVRYMLSVFDELNVLNPPLNLDYLNHIADEFNRRPFMHSNSSGYRKWQDTEEGEAHWALVCRKLTLERDMAELEKTNHANDPSKLESKRRMKKEILEELNHVKRELATFKAPAVPPVHPAPDVLPVQPALVSPMPWHEEARILGEQYFKEFPRLSIEQLADKVHKAMTEKQVTGRGGRVPKAGTIKRQALIGLKK